MLSKLIQNDVRILEKSYDHGIANIKSYKTKKEELVKQLRIDLLNKLGDGLRKSKTKPRREKFREALQRMVSGELYKELEKLAKQGFPELDKQGLDAAIADFTEIIQQEENSNSLHYYHRGWAYQEKGEFKLAIEDFEKAIELAYQEKNKHWRPISNLISYYHHCAKAYLYQGQPELGIKKLNQAIEQFPKDPWLYYHRAELYLQTGSLHLALVDVMKAESLNDNHFFDNPLRQKLKTLLHTRTKKDILLAIEKNNLPLDLKIEITRQICYVTNSLLGEKFLEQQGSDACMLGAGKLIHAEELHKQFIKEKEAKEVKKERPVNEKKRFPNFLALWKNNKTEGEEIECKKYLSQSYRGPSVNQH